LAAQRATVAWKNGGGLTREVAVHPAGSELASFDWRVSIAEIRVAGPFSVFPGVQRRMAILHGALSISIDGKATRLSPDSPPVSFPGEAPVYATPSAGAVTDLNVMTRRERFASRLTRHDVRAPVAVVASADTTLLLAGAPLRLGWERGELELAPLDAVLIEAGGRGRVTPGHAASYFHLVEIFSCRKTLPLS
jgi:environmental stress-induced protein Ves